MKDTDELNFIRIKIFVHRRTLTSVKRQPLEGEKIFANYIPVRV